MLPDVFLGLAANLELASSCAMHVPACCTACTCRCVCPQQLTLPLYSKVLEVLLSCKHTAPISAETRPLPFLWPALHVQSRANATALADHASLAASEPGPCFSAIGSSTSGTGLLQAYQMAVPKSCLQGIP